MAEKQIDMVKEMEKVKVTASPQELWEPAQPGETLENIWIPNRRERRRMLNGKGVKKNKKRQMKAVGQLFQQTEEYAKNNPNFKKDLYKALYENLIKKTENLEEQFEKENMENAVNEGNESVACGQ